LQTFPNGSISPNYLIIFLQTINLNKILMMKPERSKYTFYFCFPVIMAILAVGFTSFSFLKRELSLPGKGYIPVKGSLHAFHSISGNPEFIGETDPVIIPLKRAGRLFLIEAIVDDQSGNLVFDTGAKDLVLNSTYFRNYSNPDKITSAGITGEVGSEGQITVEKLEFADIIFKNQMAQRANLGHIENIRGVKILGLTGFGLLKNYEIVIDPVHNQLILFRIDKSGERVNGKLPGFKSDYSQKIEGSGNILFLKGSIGGKTMNFCFDTAAETNVISSSSGRNVMGTITITRRTTLKGAGSVASEVLYGRMNDFTIGTHYIGDMETVVASLFTLNEAYDTHIDGVLGYNFLEHGVVCVNFLKSKVEIRFVKGEKE
jgi:hypothetical protein